MVVVKHGALPHPGRQYKVYLNVDKLKQKWYLRVTHTYPQYNQHFRAGTYKSKEEAMEALKSLDPINPKKGRQRKGTVDQYNGQWRVRAKHRGEHMHVGYFKDREKAEQRLKEVIQDTDFLEKRYNSLIAKRKRKRESMNQLPVQATLASLQAKLKKIEQRQNNTADTVAGNADADSIYHLPRHETIGKDERSAHFFSQQAFKAEPPDRLYSPRTYSQTIRAFSNTQHLNSAFRTLFDQSETENHLLAVAAWQRMQNGLFHDRQTEWGREMDRSSSQRSEEHVTSKKKKVRIRKRCLTCSKTQIIQGTAYTLDSDPRLVYVQCESCKKEPVDVGWCRPAILQDNVMENKLLQSSPVMCDPRHFTLKSPIDYSD